MGSGVLSKPAERVAESTEDTLGMVGEILGVAAFDMNTGQDMLVSRHLDAQLGTPLVPDKLRKFCAAIDLTSTTVPLIHREKKSAVLRIQAYKAAQDQKRQSSSMSETPTGTPSIFYLVKLDNKAYIHSTWVSQSMLKLYDGVKQSLNAYDKRHKDRWKEDDRALHDPEVALGAALSPDTVGPHANPVILVPLFPLAYCFADRVISHKSPMGNGTFLIKWKHLPYDEATWEDLSLIRDLPFNSGSLAIQAYIQRVGSYYGLCQAPHPHPSVDIVDIPVFQSPLMTSITTELEKGQGVVMASEVGMGQNEVISAAMARILSKDKEEIVLIVTTVLAAEPWVEKMRIAGLPTISYVGSKKARVTVERHEWEVKRSIAEEKEISTFATFLGIEMKGEAGVRNLECKFKFSAVVTTPEIISRQKTKLSTLPVRYLIIDEASGGQKSSEQVLQQLAAFRQQLFKVFPEALCVLLTPSPLPYKTPSGLIPKGDLVLKNTRGKDSKASPTSQWIMEIPIEVSLTRAQKQSFRQICKTLQDVATTEMLDVGSLRRIVDKMASATTHRKLLHDPLPPPNSPQTPPPANPTPQSTLPLGKLNLIHQFLIQIQKMPGKVLILTQTSEVEDVVFSYLDSRGHKVLRPSGSISAYQAAIQSFNSARGHILRGKCILMTVRKAIAMAEAGYSITLDPAHDLAVAFDSNRDPSVDSKAVMYLQPHAPLNKTGKSGKIRLCRIFGARSVEFYRYLAIKAQISRVSEKETVQVEGELSRENLLRIIQLGCQGILAPGQENANERVIEPQVVSILNQTEVNMHEDLEDIKGKGEEIDIKFWRKCLSPPMTVESLPLNNFPGNEDEDDKEEEMEVDDVKDSESPELGQLVKVSMETWGPSAVQFFVSMLGLQAEAWKLVEKNITGEEFINLRDRELVDMGIVRPESRLTILSTIRYLRKPSVCWEKSLPEQTLQQIHFLVDGPQKSEGIPGKGAGESRSQGLGEEKKASGVKEIGIAQKNGADRQRFGGGGGKIKMGIRPEGGKAEGESFGGKNNSEDDGSSERKKKKRKREIEALSNLYPPRRETRKE
ncbi:hypothetical protein AAMO2058_001556000 [Amorphochlora amoebiformis]